MLSYCTRTYAVNDRCLRFAYLAAILIFFLLHTGTNLSSSALSWTLNAIDRSSPPATGKFVHAGRSQKCKGYPLHSFPSSSWQWSTWRTELWQKSCNGGIIRFALQSCLLTSLKHLWSIGNEESWTFQVTQPCRAPILPWGLRKFTLPSLGSLLSQPSHRERASTVRKTALEARMCIPGKST